MNDVITALLLGIGIGSQAVLTLWLVSNHRHYRSRR